MDERDEGSGGLHLQLVGFLEDRYGISVRDEDLVPENFQSLARIEQFVASRKG